MVPKVSPQVRDAHGKRVVEQDELESNVVNLISGDLIENALEDSEFVDVRLERFHGSSGHIHGGGGGRM
jgi:hypothetical protein